MIADKLWPRLDRTDWNFMVVDRDDQHHYPPGYLFLGGTKRPKPVTSG
jgi:sulfide:quinone oxidoreductase